MLGKALAGRRDDAVIGTKFGMDMRGANGNDFGARGLPPLHHQGRRGVAAPARHGLDRPLPVPHPGPADAHRGDPRGPRRARHQRQGPLHRPLQPGRLADRRGRIRGPRPRRSPLHLQPEPLQPAGPPRRTGGHPGSRGLRPGRAAVLPAGQRPADRQVLARAGAGGVAGSATPAPTWSTTPTGTSSVPSARSPPNAGLNEIQVAFSWLAAQPSVSSVIAGATRPEQVRQNAAAVAWSPGRRRAGRAGRDLPAHAQGRAVLGRTVLRSGVPGADTAVQSVLMDVDTGIDDALALVYLLSRPEVRLQAITCTAGNVGARQVALNNLALLELCGRRGDRGGRRRRGAAGDPAGHHRGDPRAAGDRLRRAAAAGPADFGAARRRRLGGGGPGAPGGDHRADHRAADQLRPRPAPRTGAAPAAQGTGRSWAAASTTRATRRRRRSGTPRWTRTRPRRSSRPTAGLPEDKLPVVCALETTERIEMRPEHLRRLGEAAGAPEPELVLPEQPEGQRSTVRATRWWRACPTRSGSTWSSTGSTTRATWRTCTTPSPPAPPSGRTPFSTRLATVDVETDSPAAGRHHSGRLPRSVGPAAQRQDCLGQRPRAVLRRADFLGGRLGPLPGRAVAAGS